MKSMVVLLTSRIKEAARLCGMSPSRWVSKRLYEAATNDIQRAHVALLDANVRDKHEVEMREQAAVERARRADEQDRQRFREQLAQAVLNGFAHEQPLTPPSAGSGQATEQQVSNYNRDVDTGLIHPAERDREEVVKQYRDDYFEKYQESSRHLEDVHIWQIHRDVRSLDKVMSPTEFITQVLRRMHVYKLNNTEPQIKPV